VSRPMFVALWTRLALPWVLLLAVLSLVMAAKWPWVRWFWRVAVKGTSRKEADSLWKSFVFAGDRAAGAAEQTVLGPELELFFLLLQISFASLTIMGLIESHGSDPGTVPPSVTRRQVALALLAEAPSPCVRMSRLSMDGAGRREEGPWQEAGAAPLGPLGEGELMGATIARM